MDRLLDYIANTPLAGLCSSRCVEQLYELISKDLTDSLWKKID